MYKVFFFVLLTLALSSESDAEKLFTEKHLGFEFKYDDKISINFDPHAMRKIPIYYNSFYAGGLVVSVLPEGVTEKLYMDYGLNRYKSDYGKKSVTLSRKANESGFEYYHFVVKTKSKGKNITIEKAIFIKTRKSIIKKEGIKVTYTINYGYSEDKQMKALGKIVNSFKLIPNEAHYNDALLLSIKKQL